MLDEWKSLEAYESADEENFYVWDLRKGIPKSLFC